MLRVGLTGGLGSGKSTVGAMLARHGAHVSSADEIGREMMRPGNAVYAQIVARFGPGVVQPGGELDRAELACLAFSGGRVEELNAIVHPAVIARQAQIAEEIAAGDPDAVVVVESALIFETKYGETNHGESGGDGGWRRRFDRVVLVTAPEAIKVCRFVDRSLAGRAASQSEMAELHAEARRRLSRQIADAGKEPLCDFVLRNEGTVAELKEQVDALWMTLRRDAASERKDAR